MMPTSAPCPLAIRLFGPFEACLHGKPLPRLHTRKSQWVLALLTLRAGQIVERSWLSGLLWPDQRTADALGALRRSLTDLRRALGAEAWRLQSPGRPTLRLELAGAFADVLLFDAAIARAGVADTEQGSLPRFGGKADSGGVEGERVQTSLSSAISLYRGPLLEGCTESWAFQERLVREQAYLTALETVADHALKCGDRATAESSLRAATAADPLRDSAHRRLMALLAEQGDYAAAVLVYRELRLRLHRELNVEPDPETVALFRQVQAGAACRRERRNGAPGHPRALSALLSTPVPNEEPPRHNLPQAVTRFIGREREIAALTELLQGEERPLSRNRETSENAKERLLDKHSFVLSPPSRFRDDESLAFPRRLVTLTGAGGCGKSRLALETAWTVLDVMPDGVWLVELASLADPALLPQAVATVLDIRERPGEPLTDTLVRALKKRQILLVLDNCDHLLAACVTLVDAVLRGCPSLRVLATSREALQMLGETTYRIPGLSLPIPEGGDRQLTTLLQSEAVRLFVDRAATVEPSFVLTPRNAEAVATICRRLDGIPLALEMAAARVRAMTVETLAERIDDCFRLLTDGNRAALPRHRTLRAMIDWSYNLISEQEKALLRRLSIFAGGWTLEAAEAVCGELLIADCRLMIEETPSPSPSPISNQQSR